MVGVSVETIFGKEVYIEDASVPLHISGTAVALVSASKLEELCKKQERRIIIDPSKIRDAFENAANSPYSPAAKKRKAENSAAYTT